MVPTSNPATYRAVRDGRRFLPRYVSFAGSHGNETTTRFRHFTTRMFFNIFSAFWISDGKKFNFVKYSPKSDLNVRFEVDKGGKGPTSSRSPHTNFTVQDIFNSRSFICLVIFSRLRMF